MDRCAGFRLLADYNRWMNDKVYEAAGRLDAAALAVDRRAFFGSILGTLNHLVVADLTWLGRFSQHPAWPSLRDSLREWPVPASLDHVLYPDFVELRERRGRLDRLFQAWVCAMKDSDLETPLEYRNMKGVLARRETGSLVLHLFNHQTHHRGQTTTLLTQAGQDVGVTDLLMLIPNMAEAG